MRIVNEENEKRDEAYRCRRIWTDIMIRFRPSSSRMLWLYYQNLTTSHPHRPGIVQYRIFPRRTAPSKVGKVNRDKGHPHSILRIVMYVLYIKAGTGRGYQGYGTACPRPFPWNCSTASCSGSPVRGIHLGEKQKLESKKQRIS